MIAFACSHCGMKLKVQDQFAGRPAKCPTCKQPLAVPLPSATVPCIPPQQIDGEESSLAKAGLGGGVTLDNDPAGRRPTAIAGQKPQRSISEALAQRPKSTQRYVVEGEIARGGMGAVLRAVDCDIRREVAVKYMLDDKDPKKKARFIEEAQINGQLEHPNIVPVYDLGIDAQKRPFIMMKMVKGRSLKDVLDQLRDNPQQAEKDFSLGRLLNILVSVCNALAFAHARGVVHRDLKPANIMLGDFGEVYVMDWGLAKVLNQPGAADKMSVPAPAASASVPGRNSQVATNRGLEADLTQEGSVLGTPVYMPPEQATGNLNAIDQRSDIYSLGAILYEMLTLQPPVTKEGGHLSVLMQVVQGEIIPPQRREPKRTRAGQVPNELAAIAMKALAKEKDNRYPTADALRQDIERFQEGRSVSAKQDTAREMLWKLVKRNKAVSAVTAGFLIVLLWGAWMLIASWRETRRNFNEYQQAQAAKEDQTKKSIPAFLRAARMFVNERNLKDALEQLDLALQYDEKNPDLLLFKGQVLIGQSRFAEAGTVLEQYRQVRPQDGQAAALAELCGTREPTAATRADLAAILTSQGHGMLAAGLYQSNQQQLPIYRMKIEAAWPGLGGRFNLTKDAKFALNLHDQRQVTDLSPLRGMPLSELSLHSTSVRDLSPLRGMPLRLLHCGDCPAIADLMPLAGMPLTDLNLYCCYDIEDLSPLAGMKLVRLNASTDRTGRVMKLRDLGPLKGMPLTALNLSQCSQVRDLAPLAGLPLISLNLSQCSQVRDLAPLAGMPLTHLYLNGCRQVRDLAPLQGMPLHSLNLPDASLDLTPLGGLKLEELGFLNTSNHRKGLNVLRGIKTLRTINGVKAEEFWKKFDASELK